MECLVPTANTFFSDFILFMVKFNSRHPQLHLEMGCFHKGQVKVSFWRVTNTGKPAEPHCELGTLGPSELHIQNRKTLSGPEAEVES